MIFAFINDNEVKKLEEHDEFNSITDGHHYQAVIDVTSSDPAVQVGWAYDAGLIYNKLPDVTPRQIRQALILSGVSMAMIEEALNSLPEPTRSLALVEWEYSIAFKRRNPLVMSVGGLLGWTSAQIDDLWTFAGKL